MYCNVYVCISIIVFSLVLRFGQALQCSENYKDHSRVKRVVSGFDVGGYKYPFYSVLQGRYASWVHCGGSLIAPNVVVTAAHCYKQYLLQNKIFTRNITKLEQVFIVKLGVYDMCIKNEPTKKDFKVRKVRVHESYLDHLPYDDIALLFLEGDTSSYQPICLPSPKDYVRPKDAEVIGHGATSYNGRTSCHLREAKLLIHNDTVCHNMIKSTDNDDTLMHGNFCAGYLTGGIDACQGDSGGPLFTTTDDGRYVLLGLVSFGFHCAEKDRLGLYTEMTQYEDWIYSVMKEEGY